jgi:hypothetical protein
MLFGGNISTAQVEEGNMLIDLYYGFPNSSKTLYSTFESVPGYKSKGIGPVGGRFTYMIADNFGVGVDVNYVSGGAEYTDEVSEYDSTTMTWTDNTYSIERSVTKIRVMARFDYHFVQTEMADAYVGFGAGYKYKNTTWRSTNPNGTEDELDGGLFDGLVPVAARIAVGTRLFFTDNIGINLELGLGGGPLMSGGLSLKF